MIVGDSCMLTLAVLVAQPDEVSVNVKITDPDVMVVTAPVFGSIDATPGLLLAHVPAEDAV